MTRTLLTLLFILPGFIHAQNFSLKMSPPASMTGQISFSYFAGMAANHYYYAQVPNVGKMELIAYDFSGKKTGVSNMELDVDGKKAQIERVLTTKNNSYALSTCYDKKEDKSYAFLHKISPDGNIETKGTAISANDKSIAIGHNRLIITAYADNDATGLFRSKDSLMMAYIESTSENQNTKAEKIMVTVLDENLNKKWGREVAFKYTDKEMRIESIHVCNDGRVVVAASISNIKGYRHEKVAEYRCKLFVVDDKSVTEIDADFAAEVAPNDFEVVWSSGNELTVCGTYDIQWRYTSGVFIFKADMSTGKIIKYKMQPVKMEDLDLGKAKGELKKKQGIQGGELVSGIRLNDGRYIVTMSQSLSGSETVQSYDKLIFEFDADLNPKYSFGIKGWTSASPGNSVMTVPFNGSYAVLYLDNDARGNLFAVFVNSKGERSSPQMFPTPKMYFKPWNSEKIDDKRILVETEAFGNYQFGVLSAK